MIVIFFVLLQSFLEVKFYILILVKNDLASLYKAVTMPVGMLKSIFEVKYHQCYDK